MTNELSSEDDLEGRLSHEAVAFVDRYVERAEQALERIRLTEPGTSVNLFSGPEAGQITELAISRIIAIAANLTDLRGLEPRTETPAEDAPRQVFEAPAGSHVTLRLTRILDPDGTWLDLDAVRG